MPPMNLLYAERKAGAFTSVKVLSLFLLCTVPWPFGWQLVVKKFTFFLSCQLQALTWHTWHMAKLRGLQWHWKPFSIWARCGSCINSLLEKGFHEPKCGKEIVKVKMIISILVHLLVNQCRLEIREQNG